MSEKRATEPLAEPREIFLILQNRWGPQSEKRRFLVISQSGGKLLLTSNMKSKVFVSCGQRSRERDVARKIGELLEERGLDAYVAINAQTLMEINTGVIRELKNSDYYLFVNFRRDLIGDEYQGSLFSHQELAIAYALGFERILVVSQRGAPLEGMLRHIGINTEEFEGLDDCCAVVARALDRSGWTPDYTRRMRADNLRLSPRDELLAFGSLIGRFLYVDVINGRPDIAALEATARLSEFGPSGGPLRASPIRSPLKATARPGFSHTIFPKSHEAYDLLCIGATPNRVASGWKMPSASGTVEGPIVDLSERGVYLNSALDIVGAGHLPITLGVWTLRYEFYAIDFPLVLVSIELAIPDWNNPAMRIVARLESALPILRVAQLR